MSAGDGVWAIGDVTGIWPLTYVGKYHGRIAAANILGEHREADYTAVPRVVFTHPQAAAVGAPDGPVTATISLSAVPKTATYLRAWDEHPGFLTLISDGEVLTGAYGLGPEAGEWMQQATHRDPRPNPACGPSRHDPAVPDVLGGLPLRPGRAHQPGAGDAMRPAQVTRPADVCVVAYGRSAIGRVAVGQRITDFELLDHAGNRRRLSELVGGDPTVLQFFRGWWCPKEQSFFRRLLRLQEDAEVAYSRILSVSVDPPEVNAAFRAGLGARWTFLSDPDRDVQTQLGLRETTDTLNDPYVPAVFLIDPELCVRAAYNGYWYWGRPTQDELVKDPARDHPDAADGLEAPTP